MPSNAPSSDTRSHLDRLLLRVARPDGVTERLYVAPGLTIGRSPGNTVPLVGDTSVDGTHAKVVIQPDGTAWLECLGARGRIVVNGLAFEKLLLEVGTAFQIGQTHFECVTGQSEGLPRQLSASSTCPHCASEDVPVNSPGPCACPTCEEPLIVLPPHRLGATPDIVPARFGNYWAEEFIARGGMGIILKGRGNPREADCGLTVAIKLVRPDAQLEDQAIERFQHEAQLMQKISDSNVLRILASGQAGTCHYLVMEWIEGRTLQEVIENKINMERCTPYEQAHRWLMQIGSGLESIHALGFVHRDIKPSNILIDHDDHARLGDLGIARPIDGQLTGLTMTGQVPGTLVYMAPEQVDAPGAVDHRVDQYAFAVMAHQLLSGELPHWDSPPLSTVNNTVPPELDDVLRRARARRPQDRFETMSALLTALPQPPHRCGSRPSAPDAQRNLMKEVQHEAGGDTTRRQEARAMFEMLMAYSTIVTLIVTASIGIWVAAHVIHPVVEYCLNPESNGAILGTYIGVLYATTQIGPFIHIAIVRTIAIRCLKAQLVVGEWQVEEYHSDQPARQAISTKWPHSVRLKFDSKGTVECADVDGNDRVGTWRWCYWSQLPFDDIDLEINLEGRQGRRFHFDIYDLVCPHGTVTAYLNSARYKFTRLSMLEEAEWRPRRNLAGDNITSKE